MNIKLLMMITGAMVLSDVGFASSSLPKIGRAPTNYDLVDETREDTNSDGDIITVKTGKKITDPAKYDTKNVSINHYVYQAGNDVVDILQENIDTLRTQAIALKNELKSMQAEMSTETDFARTQPIEKKRLGDLLR